MSGFSFKTSGTQQPTDGVRQPVTDSRSKSVMLAAERNDEITITSTERVFKEDRLIPSKVSVIQRSATYFGPKILTTDNRGREYLITAPGPDCFLYLWAEEGNEGDGRRSWIKMAEIRASLEESSKGYHLCHQCNEPLKTAEHERMAAIGQCPNI